MADELTFQQRQRQAYNEVVGRYIFEVEYPGAPIVQSRELTVTKAGIKLYFLRHGAFDKNATDSTIDVAASKKEEKPKPIKVTKDGTEPLEEFVITHYPNYPQLHNHYYAETSIRQGYIYILFAEDDSLWLEYQVVMGGGLRPIIWEQGSTIAGNDGFYDVRQPDNTIIDSGISVAQCDVVWVAFSDVQWSVAYHQKMRSDTSARAARMQRIECTGLQPNEEIPWVKSYDQVDAVFTAEESIQARWLHHRLEQVQLEDTDPELKEDMFIILQDPIGIAEDIGYTLEQEYHKLDAIIESIQTGQDYKAIYNRLRSGQPYRAALSVYEKQINALFSYSLTVYQTIYNHNEAIEKLGKTTDKNKLLQILGVDLRKQQRAYIIKLRDDFGICQQSQLYQNRLNDYVENTADGIFRGYELQKQHLSLLAIHPQYKDYQFDLKHQHNYNKDRWASYYNRILQEDESLITPKLLMAGVEFTDLSDTGLSANEHLKIETRFAKSLKGILDAFAKYATDQFTYTATLKYLKSFTVNGQNVFQFKKGDLATNTPKGLGLNLKMVTTINTKKGSVFATIATNQSRQAIEEAVVNKKITLELERVPSEMAKKIERLLASTQFRAFIAGLELLNLAVKLKDLSNEFNIKNLTNSFGALAKTLSAARAYQEAILIKRGAVPETINLSNRTMWGKGLGVIGSGITVIMCMVDAVKSYNAKDYDASIAWIATSAMAAVTVLNSGISFYSSYMAKGKTVKKLPTWQVITANALFFAGLVIAIYYTDTPLQKFLKNNALNSDTKPEGVLPTYPHEYSNMMYEQRDTLVEKGSEQWADFDIAAKDLYDLIIGYRTDLQIIDKDYPYDPEYKERTDFGKWKEEQFKKLDGIKHLKSFAVRVTLRKFIYNTSSLECELYFFPKGLSNTMDKERIECHTITLDEEHHLDVLVLTYRLTTKQYQKISAPPYQQESSMFMLVSRALLDGERQEYWPSQRDQDRYHGFIFRADDLDKETVFGALEESIKPVTDIFGTNIKIGTKSELIGTVS
ncbi:toxin VasX [Aquimarina longa]|uniref:toxin VasX n=1 Tax=Aquimarina longa TaxID=1080221 RepID=UPI000783B271|nr:toxin VasX [Aquimarina longa]